MRRFLVWVLAAIAIGCHDNPAAPPPPTPSPVGSVALLLDTLTTVPGAQLYRLGTRVLDTLGQPLPGYQLSWTSSDHTKATVDSFGIVQVLATGSVDIVAAGGKHADTLHIHIVNFDFAQISAGQDHTCGLTTGQVAVCWGTGGRYSWLGLPDSGLVVSGPVAVQGAPPLVSVSAGREYSCGLTSAGTAYCWGSNGFDQLGIGHRDFQAHLPTAVAGGLTFASIVPGETVTCGITTAGAAYCWGADEYGQVGHGGSGASVGDSVPLAVAGGLTFRAISPGLSSTCGIAADSTAYCWGLNAVGEVGVFPLPAACDTLRGNPYCSVPVQVSNSLKFISIAVSTQYACGVVASGAAYCWGQNHLGSLGDSTLTVDSVPGLVIGGHSFVSLTTGYDHACGLTSAGQAWCWGSGGFGELGNGSTSNSALPQIVSGGLVFSALSAGDYPTCGVTTAHVAYCWGENINASLGVGGYPTPINIESTPTKVVGQP